MMTAAIYPDYNATIPVDPRVLEAMLPYFDARHGNPSSDHVVGQHAKAAVEAARSEVAELIGRRLRNSFSPAAPMKPTT